MGECPAIRSVRYVYQPMEALNLVVITNKASNILEERSSAAAQQNGSVARFESKLMRLAVASQTSDVLEDLETLRLLAKAWMTKSGLAVQIKFRLGRLIPSARFGFGLRPAVRSHVFLHCEKYSDICNSRREYFR